MAFSDTLTNDATDVFLKEFAEDVVYTPSGGTPRTIKAVVRRQPFTQLAEMTGIERPIFVVWVANNGTTGILSQSLETSADTLTFSILEGGTPEALKIQRILHQDDGMMALEVR